MNEALGIQNFWDLFRLHPVSTFFLGLILATVVMVVAVRWWFRRRLRALLEERFNEENELDALPSPGPRDQEALEVIKDFRRKVWAMPEPELQLGVEALMQRAIAIVQAIAAVYHPQAEVPQYEASLSEILQLIRRVSGRLSRLSSSAPFKYLGYRRLADYQRYYRVYRKINENPVLQALRQRPYLYRIAKWAMNVKNIANPVYWAGKELSREGYFYMLRWFYLTFVSNVGREAMRLYSGRHFQTEETRDAALVCYRLFALTLQWGGPSPEEWAAWVSFVSSHAAIEPETKLHILSRCSEKRLPNDIDEQRAQTASGLKWYRQGLKRLLEESPSSSLTKRQIIERELALASGDVSPEPAALPGSSSTED